MLLRHQPKQPFVSNLPAAGWAPPWSSVPVPALPCSTHRGGKSHTRPKAEAVTGGTNPRVAFAASPPGRAVSEQENSWSFDLFYHVLLSLAASCMQTQTQTQTRRVLYFQESPHVPRAPPLHRSLLMYRSATLWFVFPSC